MADQSAKSISKRKTLLIAIARSGPDGKSRIIVNDTIGLLLAITDAMLCYLAEARARHTILPSR